MTIFNIILLVALWLQKFIKNKIIYGIIRISMLDLAQKEKADYKIKY